MNQIRLGATTGIDTDEVLYWGERGDSEEPQTLVMFKNGEEAILRGEAREAFDEWAKRRPKAGKNETLVSIVENHEHGHHHTPYVDMTDDHPPIYHSHIHEKHRHHRRPEREPVRVKPEQQGIGL